MTPPSASLSRWQPPPLLWGSALWHAAVALMGWQAPAHWPLWLALLALNHAAVAAVGLWPRSQALGQTLVRLPECAETADAVAITIDDGPDPEVTPQVLALLAQHGARATFFCIGERARAHPQLCRAIVQAGHEIGNHGERHPHWASLMGLAGWRREVGDGQRTLLAITGQSPRWYRAVAGLRNPFLFPVLHAMGLHLAAWTRRGFDTRDAQAARVLARLLNGMGARDVLLLHDGHAARTAEGQPMILAVLPGLLAELERRRLRTARLSDSCLPRSKEI